MKRSPLKRKTPLKARKGLTTKKPLTSKSTLKSTSSLKRTPMKTKTHGLKGHGRSAVDVSWHDQVASKGCFACRVLGVGTHLPVRIHHPRGRSKGKAGDCSERFVIALCDDHHDPSTNPAADRFGPSVHGNKKLFKEMVGTEEWCVLETYKGLNTQPPWLVLEEWEEYLQLHSQEEQEDWILESGHEIRLRA